MRGINFHTELLGQVMRVTVRGHLVHENSQDFETMLNDLGEGAYKVVEIDLCSADFLPSFCFGMLLKFAEHINTLGKRVCLMLKSHHAHLAKSVGLDTMMLLKEK